MYFRLTLLLAALAVSSAPVLAAKKVSADSEVSASESSRIIDIKDVKEYDQALKDAGSKLVVVRFSSEYCHPCKQSAPGFTAVSKMDEYKDVVFIKINIDKVRDLSDRYDITGVPVTLFLKDGEEIDRVTGKILKGELMDRLDDVLMQAPSEKVEKKIEVIEEKPTKKEKVIVQEKSYEVKKEKKRKRDMSCKTCPMQD